MARVLSVSKSPSHSFSKPPTPSITLIKDLGVDGDCHKCASPSPLNLRQVHLLPVECLREVSASLSKPLAAGSIGENVTTEGIDLLSLPKGSELHFVDVANGGNKAVVVLTGVRNPGRGFERFQKGLGERFVVRDGSGRVVRRLAGVMGVVKEGGVVRAGMGIQVVRPAKVEALQIF